MFECMWIIHFNIIVYIASLIKRSCDTYSACTMPYWSIAEWRARIGCSWSAMNRPKKIKSSIRHGARIGKKELTLNRIVNMLIILTMLIGVNIGVRGLVASGHHHQLISSFIAILCNILLFCTLH